MRADVAVAEGAENGIGDRVEHDVGVGMTDKAAVVRDRDAAEHHLVAGAKCVHVEADADAHVTEAERLLGKQTPVRRCDVGDRSELGVDRIARDHQHRYAGPFGNGGIIGKRDTFRGSAIVGGADTVEGETLRRFGRLDAIARDRAGDMAVGDALQRAGDRQRRDHGLRTDEGADDPVDHLTGTNGRAASWISTRPG